MRQLFSRFYNINILRWFISFICYANIILFCLLACSLACLLACLLACSLALFALICMFEKMIFSKVKFFAFQMPSKPRINTILISFWDLRFLASKGLSWLLASLIINDFVSHFWYSIICPVIVVLLSCLLALSEQTSFHLLAQISFCLSKLFF